MAAFNVLTAVFRAPPAVLTPPVSVNVLDVKSTAPPPVVSAPLALMVMEPLLFVTPALPSVMSRPEMVRLPPLATLRLMPVALELPSARVGFVDDKVMTPVWFRVPLETGVMLTFPLDRTSRSCRLPL